MSTDRRSPNTRRAYAKDINDFFVTLTGDSPTPQAGITKIMSPSRLHWKHLAVMYVVLAVSQGIRRSTP